MSGYGGELALMALPDDWRLHVQLSRYFYGSTLKRVRDDLAANRTGIAVVEVATPINAPVLEVALDRRSVYLLGFRARGAREWWGFVADGCPPALPGGAVRAIRGRSTYPWLGLPERINITPVRLLSGLAGFGGTVDSESARRLVLLLFLLPEALRFDNVLMECSRYLSIGTSFAHVLHPARYRATVTNWSGATRGDPNVLLAHAGRQNA